MKPMLIPSMNSMQHSSTMQMFIPAWLLLIGIALTMLIMMLCYWLTMGRERRKWLPAFVATLVLVGATVWRSVALDEDDDGQLLLAAFLLFAGVGGLVMAGWSSWGLTGWRQWLRWRVAIWAGVMAFGAGAVWSSDASDGWSGDAAVQWVLAGLTPFMIGALLCAVPEKPKVGEGAGAASADRERVLGLLERGAISGDEAAELLAALGERQPGSGSSVMGQRLRWIGVVLVVLGFYVPWAKVDVGKEMEKLQSGMMQQMQAGWSGFAETKLNGVVVQDQSVDSATTSNSFSAASPGPVVAVYAADLRHGLGWVILGLAVAAGVLPLFREFRRLPVETRGTTLYSVVGVGLLMSLYMAVQLFEYAQIGLALNLAGYALMLVAVRREYPQP